MLPSITASIYQPPEYRVTGNDKALHCHNPETCGNLCPRNSHELRGQYSPVTTDPKQVTQDRRRSWLLFFPSMCTPGTNTKAFYPF